MSLLDMNGGGERLKALRYMELSIQSHGGTEPNLNVILAIQEPKLKNLGLRTSDNRIVLDQVDLSHEFIFVGVKIFFHSHPRVSKGTFLKLTGINLARTRHRRKRIKK